LKKNIFLLLYGAVKIIYFLIKNLMGRGPVVEKKKNISNAAKQKVF